MDFDDQKLSKLFKVTHRENALPNKMQALTKSVNMGIGQFLHENRNINIHINIHINSI